MPSKANCFSFIIDSKNRRVNYYTLIMDDTALIGIRLTDQFGNSGFLLPFRRRFLFPICMSVAFFSFFELTFDPHGF